MISAVARALAFTACTAATWGGFGGAARAEGPPADIVSDVRTVLRDIGRPAAIDPSRFEFRAVSPGLSGQIRSEGDWTYYGDGFSVVAPVDRSSVEFYDEARRKEIREDPDAGPGALTDPEVGWRVAERVPAGLTQAEPGQARARAWGLTPYRRRLMSDDRLAWFTFAPRHNGVPSSFNGVSVTLDMKDLRVVGVDVSRGWRHVDATPISRADAAERVRAAYEQAARASPRSRPFNGAPPDWTRVPEQLKLAYAAPVRRGDPLWPEQAVRMSYHWGFPGWGCNLDAETGRLLFESRTGGGSAPVSAAAPREPGSLGSPFDRRLLLLLGGMFVLVVVVGLSLRRKAAGRP